MRSGFVVVAVAVVFARFAGWLLLLLFLVGGGVLEDCYCFGVT